MSDNTTAPITGIAVQVPQLADLIAYALEQNAACMQTPPGDPLASLAAFSRAEAWFTVAAIAAAAAHLDQLNEGEKVRHAVEYLNDACAYADIDARDTDAVSRSFAKRGQAIVAVLQEAVARLTAP